MHPDVDAYLRDAGRWRQELTRLRSILLDTELTETLKWRRPCYTFQDGNVAMLGGLKEYCVLGFLKGTLLEDPGGVLTAPGKDSQSMRQLRFTGVGQIEELEPTIREYIRQAIEVERAGLKIDRKANRELVIPDELAQKFTEMPALKTAFEALTPGRQRGYVLHFSGAKQPQTRVARIERWAPRILEGKGMND
jgi:uncharacterized protein YdeI (YjbR/CyaY-like superfamily)